MTLFYIAGTQGGEVQPPLLISDPCRRCLVRVNPDGDAEEAHMKPGADGWAIGTFPGDSRTYPSEIPNLLLEVARKRPASCMHKKPAAAAPPPGPVRKAKTRATGGRPPAAPLEGVAQGQQKDRACAAPRAKKPAPSSKRVPKTDSKNVHSRAYHNTLSMCKRAGMPEEEAKERARKAGKDAVAAMLAGSPGER